MLLTKGAELNYNIRVLISFTIQSSLTYAPTMALNNGLLLQKLMGSTHALNKEA